MGKLHKIRKAVEANPGAFMHNNNIFGSTVWGVRFYGVNQNGIVHDGKARPDYSRSHRSYVRKVLRDLGHQVR